MTANDLIKRAMRLVGALGSGETPTAQEGSDGLEALNSMLDQWWLMRLAVYRIQEDQYTWTSGQASRTIGPTGQLVSTVRPVKVESAAQILLDIDYPIVILTQEQYRGIPAKSIRTTLMTDLYYDPTLPNGTLYGYPIPSVNAEIKLRTRTQLQRFSDLTDVVVLPPGYEQTIVYNLAVLLGPEYERAVPADVGREAILSLMNLKRFNHETPRSVVEPGIMKDPPYFDWRSGDT